MPLNAVGWTSEENITLIELVKPHTFLYNLLDPSRKNILARETTWQKIAETLLKPAEECKKRWRCLRDSYMRCKRLGTMHKTKANINEKLQFLDALPIDEAPTDTHGSFEEINMDEFNDASDCTEQQVITDNQEYYEITLVDGHKLDEQKNLIKLLPNTEMKFQSILKTSEEPPRKIGRKNSGRKKSAPMPRNLTPVKILPKPITNNQTNIVRLLQEPTKTPEQRSQVIDKLIEKIFKENTNEIDVFFKSMAASVKKLQPHLIPKVKMEVCNVIAKYEMLSFEKQIQHN